jgi:hypothetical protein
MAAMSLPGFPIRCALEIAGRATKVDGDNPRLFKLGLERGMGAARRSDRGRGFRGLCALCMRSSAPGGLFTPSVDG